jgi:hypothetical protein
MLWVTPSGDLAQVQRVCVDKQRHEHVAQPQATDSGEPAVDEEVVAAAAERVLGVVSQAPQELSVEPPQSAGRTVATPAPSEAIAEIHDELDAVHSELSQVTTGVVALQTNSLRLTGVAALVLAVLIAVAWKVVGG